MRRFRIRRRRALALALVPAAALTIGSMPAPAATGDEDATLDGRGSVRFGDRVKLSGEFPGSGEERVAILYRPARESQFRQVASTRTRANGRWSARVKPRRTGAWQARLVEDDAVAATDSEPAGEEAGSTAAAAPRDTQSNARRIRVRSVTRVSVPRRHTTVGGRLKVRGRVLPAGAPRQVTVNVGGRRLRTRANRSGRFAVRWRAPSTGTYRVAAIAKRNRYSDPSRDGGGTVIAYRRAAASWYGPGLYGNRTACGQTLTPSLRGVAHKTMPCGTRLKLRYGSRTVSVRVVDRGPYVGGREFDLTQATKNDLGFGSTGTVLSSR